MRYALALLLLATAAANAQSNTVALSSPDGRLTIAFETVQKNQPASEGQLVYSISVRGKPLLNRSRLSLELRDQQALGTNVQIINATNWTTDETYSLVAGKASPVHNHFNAIRVSLQENHDLKRELIIEARAYNDAIAFRYIVPDQSFVTEFALLNEDTEFRVSQDATAYALVLPNFQSQYEGEFIKLPVSAFANQGGVAHHPLIGLPLLMEFPGVAWMAITEADLRGYAAMYLVNSSTNWPERWLEARVAPNTNDTNVCVVGSLPQQSPWRVLLIGATPGKLIESTVIKSLNPESAISDTSWIRPGKCAWDWWSGSIGPDGKSAYNDATMKHYVDFAARSGFEYMLVDSGWSSRDDITKMNGKVNIPELVKYGATRNVKIWIWAHWSAVKRQMDKAFPLFEQWGVAGVKIDFMSRDDQEMIAFYYRVAETAAKHHLLIDFHGATKPTGMERTWPNVLGYEGVLGMEWSKATARDNPDHHLMIPFTRMLAGTMDYTPGAFNNVTREEFEPLMQKPMVMGTRAHQLAMYVVYECPLQMVSDQPGAYDAQRAFQFIRNVPATWNETRALNGVPGEYITLARRSGEEWFLGSMCNNTARTMDVPLNFLGDGRYSAEIYFDAPDADRTPSHVVIENRIVRRGSTLKIPMAPAGGCAVRFVPKR